MNVDISVVEYPMQAIAATVAALLGIRPPRAAEAGPIAEVVHDLDGVKRVAILGVDALGLGIWRHWRDQTSFLNGLADSRMATLRAIMTSKTPVNFGCMVTGARMEVHGATTREQDFACETLFDVLRAAGKTSAALGRKGWTGNDLLGRFADISLNGAAETDEEVEQGMEAIIAEHRPDFVIVQFGLTDEVFHTHGPFSEEAGRAIAAADGWLARCVPRLRERGYGMLVLADHGQHEVQQEDGSVRGAHGTDTDEDCVVPLVWTR